MPVTAVVGTQWGDEGKGRVIDNLAEDADIVARFQGGPNAGHTVVIKDKKFKLHHIPSGVIRGKECFLGNGMVIDPKGLLNEIETLEKEGIKVDKITISERAHVITEKQIQEDSKDKKLGTTKRGIGPTYTDKAARKGKRFFEISNEYPALQKYIGDVSLKLNQAIDSGKNILLEGAQGTQLDIDFGTYPYVTSSNTIAGAACTGLGIGPTKIDKVIGVAKAYTTRVGKGPFPTELTDKVGKHLLEKGNEFGTTTGRPRRCGWFDSVLVNYAIRISGISELALTKLDVLTGLGKLKICTSYNLDGSETQELPIDLSKCKPNFVEFPGWNELPENLAEKGYQALPQEAKQYIEAIEKYTKTKIKLISFGPARSDTFIKG